MSPTLLSFEEEDSQSNPTSGTLMDPQPGLKTSPTRPTRAVREVKNAVAALHLATDGGGGEQLYWSAINGHFANYEIFWRDLVVPMTKRIELPVRHPDRCQRREDVADDAWAVSYINYSVFLNLVAAFEHLSQPVSLSLGSFYTHLASACDLAEEFLLSVHLLISRCLGKPVPELDPDSKEEFLEKLDRWYDARYAKLYELYHKKGQAINVRVSPRDKLLCRYFEKQEKAWKACKCFAQAIREYRNKVVHDVQLGTVRVGKINLMPRIDKIQKYAAMSSIQEALNSPEVLKRDFVVREEQMFSDFRKFKECLNGLWEKPTKDLTRLLYDDLNSVLLAKYNLV